MDKLANDAVIRQMQKPGFDPVEYAHRLINTTESESLVNKYLEFCDKSEALSASFKNFGKENVGFLENQFEVTEGIGGIYDAIKNLTLMNRRKLNQIRESFEVNEKKVFEEFESLQVLKETRLILERTAELNHLFLGCSVFLSKGHFKETAKILLKIQAEINELEQEDVLGSSLIKHLKNHLEKKVQEFVMVSKEKFYKLVFEFCSMIADEQATKERKKEKTKESEVEQDFERLKSAKQFFENIFLQKNNTSRKNQNSLLEEYNSERETKRLKSLILNENRMNSFSNLCLDIELFNAVKQEALDDGKESFNRNPDLTLIRLLESFRMFGDASIPQDVKINMNMRLHKTLISFLQYYLDECSNKGHLILGEELISQSKGLSLKKYNQITRKYSFLIHCDFNQRQVNGLIEALMILIMGIFQRIYWMTQFLNPKDLNLKRIFEQFFGFSLNIIFTQLFENSRNQKRGEGEGFADDHKHQERTNEEMMADWRIISKISQHLRICRNNLLGILPSLQIIMTQFSGGSTVFFQDHLLTVALAKYHQQFLNKLHEMVLSELTTHYLNFVREKDKNHFKIISLDPIKNTKSTLYNQFINF